MGPYGTHWDPIGDKFLGWMAGPNICLEVTKHYVFEQSLGQGGIGQVVQAAETNDIKQASFCWSSLVMIAPELPNCLSVALRQKLCPAMICKWERLPATVAMRRERSRSCLENRILQDMP